MMLDEVGHQEAVKQVRELGIGANIGSRRVVFRNGQEMTPYVVSRGRLFQTAAAMSVFLKSAPLNRSGSPVAFASA